MNAEKKKLLDKQFDDIVNDSYCKPHPELPDTPAEAFEHHCKNLERRST